MTKIQLCVLRAIKWFTWVFQYIRDTEKVYLKSKSWKKNGMQELPPLNANKSEHGEDGRCSL